MEHFCINQNKFSKRTIEKVYNISSQGKHAEARRHYEMAAKLDPENNTLKQNLAKLQRAEKKKNN